MQTKNKEFKALLPQLPWTTLSELHGFYADITFALFKEVHARSGHPLNKDKKFIEAMFQANREARIPATRKEIIKWSESHFYYDLEKASKHFKKVIVPLLANSGVENAVAIVTKFNDLIFSLMDTRPARDADFFLRFAECLTRHQLHTTPIPEELQAVGRDFIAFVEKEFQAQQSSQEN